jgi:putative membrane protein
VPGFYLEGWGLVFIGAIVLGLVNFFAKPVIVVLTFPLTIRTLGLFVLVLNALMLWLMSGPVPGIQLRGFGSAILGSLLFSLLNLVVSAMVRR